MDKPFLVRGLWIQMDSNTGGHMWVRFDDETAENPNLWKLSDGAFRLWFASICYSQKWLTDGAVPVKKIRSLIPRFKPSYITELITTKRWELQGDHYLIHDFTEYNETRAHWEKQRADTAKRVADWRAEKKKRRPNLEAM